MLVCWLCIMEVFSLQTFIASPSLEQINLCRKQDLLLVADHYQIVVSKQALKSDIKSKLIQRLRETNVLPMSNTRGDDEAGGGIVVGDVAVAHLSFLDDEDKRSGRADAEAEVMADAKAGLPPFDPFSPGSVDSRDGARLKVRLARLQYEAQEKAQARQAEQNLRLEVRRLEIEAETQVKLRQLDLEAMKVAAGSAAQPNPGQLSDAPPRSDPSQVTFDISKHIALVPQFRESEVDSYFNAFERIATSLRWPKEVWSLLLQCKLIGKAQEVCSTLSLEESLKYESMKSAILRAYELVPEAYRQKFRGHKKNSTQTFVEFARDKGILFDKWCTASKVRDFNELRELVLLEEFKGCLSDRVVVYLNEQKVTLLSHAAVLADEFVLTHKNVFAFVRPEKSQPVPLQNQMLRSKNSPPRIREDRECFYCHKQGHVIADCLTLKRKQQSQPKSVGFVKAVKPTVIVPREEKIDDSYRPFILKGLISLTGNREDQKEIRMLRDTGAMQSFIVADRLPFSEDTFCGSSVIIQGIEMSCINVPLHRLHLQTELCTGFVRVAVRPSLPVQGVDFILGNDLAGGRILPVLEVVDKPDVFSQSEDLSKTFPDVFPACAVTRAQSRKVGNMVDLSDTLFLPLLAGDESLYTVTTSEQKNAQSEDISVKVSDADTLKLSVSREKISAAQKEDQSLVTSFKSAISLDLAKDKKVAYFVENDLLMRKWCSNAKDSDWDVVYQIVIPSPYRQHVLCLAHDHQLAGHLGVTKTYNRILQHFFWPGLKKHVVQYCRTCHTCQTVGKPNQVIRPAPLFPIPVIGEPFEHVIIDCVGPLPKTKSGNQFLLTIMCVATRFPEAIPLRKITAPVIIKALVKFFSTFGLPKIIQSDQGTNFLSRLFKQVLESLAISHQVSSAYHPQSQGALERFHQTLKSMLRKYCLDTARDWDEGVPLVLFAVRETVQESLGFSPAELVFGHQVRGPLKVLKEHILNPDSSKNANVLDYVSTFRDRLHTAWSLAKESLANAQKGMKRKFDRKAVARSFTSGDEVLVLLPVPGSSLSARFFGPYVVKQKMSETDYMLYTPDRKRQTRVCHINMLKAYHAREKSEEKASEKTAGPAVSSVAISVELVPSSGISGADEDGVVLRNAPQQCARLANSEILNNLHSYFNHLTMDQEADVVKVISDFNCLFSDVPKQTNVLQHDIVVNGARPIKQHAYRVNAVKKSIMRQEVSYLLENDLAKPSCSPWSSPCLLVPKPDGTFRFCTDFRKVNAVTVPDSYPLPRMEDCIDNIGSARFVTKLDMLKGYWQVPLTPQASDISAFVTPDTFLQYTAMAFGLRNAPATFQRLVNIVLADVPNCNAYLDDLVLYSVEWKEHVCLLRTVFERLRKANLTLNLAKCEFGRATVTYLGKKVGQGQVRPVEAKVTAIAEFPAPTTRRELRRFLGMAGYYRSFCKNFSTVVSPLTALLSPSKLFKWSVECQYAFDCVKTLLCNAPVLVAPDCKNTFKLEVDASAVGAGAVLLQEDTNSIDHPVSYFSRKFNKHQLNYSTIEKEALALLLALQHFEVYLGSSNLPVIVFTDHNPLVFLSRMYNQNQRLMRWALVLQNYNVEIKHKKGVDNVLADALSRV